MVRPSSVFVGHEREQLVLATILHQPLYDREWILAGPEYFQQTAGNRRTDNLMLNENTHNTDHWPSRSILRFLSLHISPLTQYENTYIEKEYEARQSIGYLICDALSTPDFPVFFIQRDLRCINNGENLQMIPDLVGHPHPTSLSQNSYISLPLFCANYMENDCYRTVTQMSQFLQGTLITLILYYLDTRLAVEEPLPSWMMLYSLTFSASKFELFANIPFYQPQQDPQSPLGRRRKWGFHCTSVHTTFSNLFTEDTHEKLLLMGALLRIQNHCTFLLRQLQGWERYTSVLSLINAGFVDNIG